MTKKFSFFIALSIASLMFLFSITSRAEIDNKQDSSFLSPSEIIFRLSSRNAQRAPAMIQLGLNQPSVDLRKFDSPVADQFGATCSAFATAAAMENVLRSKGITKEVSRRDLWNRYSEYDMDLAIRAASRNHLAELQYYPDFGNRAPDYQNHRTLKINRSTHHQYRLESALKALDQGNPLVMAVQVPNDLSKCKATIDAHSRRTKGDHVMAAVGYQLDASVPGGGYLILKNSWGSDCGDRGYHYYPFALCQRNDLYCYFVEVNEVESI
jgi:C1A family cysteine protease